MTDLVRSEPILEPAHGEAHVWLGEVLVVICLLQVFGGNLLEAGEQILEPVADYSVMFVVRCQCATWKLDFETLSCICRLSSNPHLPTS